jgi:hypothetical protein
MKPRRSLALPAVSLLALGGLAGLSTGSGQGRPVAGVGTATAGATVFSEPSRSSSSSGYPSAPAAEQTHPVVLPAGGRRLTRFSLYFRLREEPGHRGVLSVDYRIWIAPPPHKRAACQPAALPEIAEGHAGAPARVTLPPPRHGWCPGTYTVTVFLQRGPYCPKPAPGGPPTPCPEFATQDLDTGRAHFTVRTT